MEVLKQFLILAFVCCAGLVKLEHTSESFRDLVQTRVSQFFVKGRDGI